MKKIALWLLMLCGISPLFSQSIDAAYDEKIREYTTDERFLPASVLHLIDHPDIPNPRKHFGQIIGAPGVMHHSQDIYDYYQLLAEASPLLNMEKVGTSEEGRPIYLIVISSEENMTQLPQIQSQMARLADPRIQTDDTSPQEIINNGKAVFYLNGGLHSPEMGSPEMLMELAYRLITDPSADNQHLLDELVILINPVSEPDGRDKQVDWYYRYTKGRKEYRDGFPKSPPYWGTYVYHDNNRDGLQVSQELTKAIFNIFFDWHPTVMLDLHESVPLLYISTGTGPYNAYVDPITIGEWQVMANYEQTQLSAQGLPGVFTWAFYDGWWPGYAIWVANNHNSIGRFYETFGNAGADTYLRDLRRSRYAGDPATSREWYRPDPPTGQVYWSIRNNTNYMQAGVLAGLKYAADNRRQLLQNFYQKGLNNLRDGERDKRKCFVIPLEQKDPAMRDYLVNQLMEQKIELHTASNGDYVINLDQPYRNLAVSLLSPQKYPPKAKFPPYDDIAWTLPYLYGVEVEEKEEMPEDKMTLLNQKQQYQGELSGKGKNFLIKNKAQNMLLPALYELKKREGDAVISSMDEEISMDGDSMGAGAIYIQGVGKEDMQELAREFGLDILQTSSKPKGQSHEISLPRIGLYHSWFYTQDEGWARFTLEQRGIPYTSIDKDDLKEGELADRFDVILIPRIRGEADRFIQGINEKFGPMPYTKTDEYPHHGYPDETEDMSGGPGLEGMANLRAFVAGGGSLITLDNSSAIMAEAGISNDIGSVRPSGLFHPGSVVRVKRRSDSSPILYGFPEVFHVFRGNGPLLQVATYDRDMMLLQYGTKALDDELPYKGEVMGMKKEEVPEEETEKKEANMPYVLSGMVRNEDKIIGHGAIFRLPVGEGRLIAFSFDPLHRYLNHHDAPLLWNALMHWNHL